VTNPQKIKAMSQEIVEAAKDKLHLSEEISQSTHEDFIFHGSPVLIFITTPVDNEWGPIDVGMRAEDPNRKNNYENGTNYSCQPEVHWLRDNNQERIVEN
jgi:hypothetical protein